MSKEVILWVFHPFYRREIRADTCQHEGNPDEDKRQSSS